MSKYGLEARMTIHIVITVVIVSIIMTAIAASMYEQKYQEDDIADLEKAFEYAKKLHDELKNLGFRVSVDDSNEKLGYRLRNAQVNKIPFTIVLGDNEVNNDSVTYRKYGTQEQITVSKEDFIKLLSEVVAEKK